MPTLDSHTIENALRREELTEEEAYFILRFAGRLGYSRAMNRLDNPLHVWRKWFIWIGGWEYPKLSQWDRGMPAWEVFGRSGKKRYIRRPFPVSLFGHRLSFQGWLRPQIRTRRGYLCVSGSYAYGLPDKCYWSPDGTPQHPQVRFFWRKKKGSEE